MTTNEPIKWHEEKWGTNEEPAETPTERPHCDDDSLKNEMTTNEPIMIDGVDVSGCKYYKERIKFEYPYHTTETCKNCGYCTHNLPPSNIAGSPRYSIARCKGQIDCYYKQLQRKN